MKVLFDHNVPYKLRLALVGHHIETAEDLGWDTLKNGNLLSEAEQEGFQVMVPADKSIFYQQNLKGRRIALVVVATNHWNFLRSRTPPIAKAVDSATPGSFQFVDFDDLPKSPRHKSRSSQS